MGQIQYLSIQSAWVYLVLDNCPLTSEDVRTVAGANPALAVEESFCWKYAGGLTLLSLRFLQRCLNLGQAHITNFNTAAA